MLRSKSLLEAFEPDLSYLLLPGGKAPQIGQEKGKALSNGISKYVSPHGSTRYVMYVKGTAVAALQVMSRGSMSRAANVFVAKGYRRKGYASKILKRAKRDFKSIELSPDRSEAGGKWAARHESALRDRSFIMEDDEQRRLRSSAMSDNHRLPNVHKIVPYYIMKKIPYSGQSEITIYRGIATGDPAKQIRPGDWVTLKKNYAKQHGSGKVIEKRVPAIDVSWAGTDENEWFYAPLRKGVK